MIDIIKLLEINKELKASDLHIYENEVPWFRINGVLNPNNDIEKIDTIIMNEIIKKLLVSSENIKELEKEKEFDSSIELENIGRFRVNIYYENGKRAISIREIPLKIPTLDSLNSPEIYKELIKRKKGLILVTGPTGSGKSTTLASMINEINDTRSEHIITIEDPVEFVHKNKKSVFSQREVGKDTKSFKNALKYSLRQDPDIIYIGEMRDKETISAALTAAETGHLVFGTLHTNSGASSINRIINVFAGNEQNQIRTQLSETLVAVISQTLVPLEDGGRTAVAEILINNSAIANNIRDNKINQINNVLETNRQKGMILQKTALKELINEGEITKEVAKEFSNNPSDFD